MKLAGIKLVDYETIVKDMARKDSNELIDNDSVHHAHILVSELVNSAKKSIKLYTNSFCQEFYLNERVLQAFEDAAKRKISLQILSEHDITENGALKKYKEIFADNIIKEKIAKGELKATFAPDSTTVLNNFMIIDAKGIRYEQEKKEDICLNMRDIKARATFNRPEDVAPFVKSFDANFAA